jgi:hypothetical protein
MGGGPLLETGEMRASIEWNAEGKEGHVGSNNDKAVWLELGTVRIPPFLKGAAMRMEGKDPHNGSACRHGCAGQQRFARIGNGRADPSAQTRRA